MSVDIKVTVHIDRDPDEVFSYLADFANNPAWQSGMASCAWTSETRGEVGSTYAQSARFMGKDIETRFVVTAREDRSISIESTKSTFPIQVTRAVDAHEGGARVVAHVRGQPTGLMKLFTPLVKISVKKDYQKLKALLESGLDRT